MPRSQIDRFLSTANSVDIILYVSEHPGCMKSDIYRNITRNAHTPEMFTAFADAGLLELDDFGNRAFLTLTEKGYRVAGMLRALKAEIEEPERFRSSGIRAWLRHVRPKHLPQHHPFSSVRIVCTFEHGFP